MEKILSGDEPARGVKDGAKHTAAVLLFCLVLAFICITIVSACSFLYEYNDWPDVNWYLTVGHGMAEGKVPYKDLFEQKGVLLYAIFALNYVLFGNAFRGIYILEILCAAAFLFVCYRIFRLGLGAGASLALTAVTLVLAYTPISLQIGGGAVEEYCLPMLAFGLYVFLSYIKWGGDKIPLWQVALCGLFSGIIFWLKYASLSFYLVFAVIVFVDRCIKKDVKSAFIYAGVFIAAFALPAVPCLIYLGVNGAIGDMAEIYLYRNLFTYGDVDILKKIGDTLLNFAYMSYFYVIAVMGVVYVFRHADMPKRFKIYCAALVAAMFLIQMVSGKHLQYHYPIVIFLPFGLYPALFYIKALFSFVKNKITAKKGGAQGCIKEKSGGIAQKARLGINVHTCVICAIFTGVLCLLLGNSTVAVFTGNDYAQLAVAKTVKEHSGGRDYSLLTFMIGDEGFYTACDVAPDVYYFAANDFSEESFPEMYEEVRSYVSQGKVDYVITESRYYLSEGAVFEEGGYEVIGEYSYTRIKGNFKRKYMEYVLLAKI